MRVDCAPFFFFTVASPTAFNVDLGGALRSVTGRMPAPDCGSAGGRAFVRAGRTRAGRSAQRRRAWLNVFIRVGLTADAARAVAAARAATLAADGAGAGAAAAKAALAAGRAG